MCLQVFGNVLLENEHLQRKMHDSLHKTCIFDKLAAR